MKIGSVHTIPVTPRGHGTLGYLVIVRTDDGLAGVGEIASDCHPATVAQAVRQFQVVGRDAGGIEALHQDDKVELRGFGSFRIRQRRARQGRNPKTGEKVRVPAKRIPYFKFELKNARVTSYSVSGATEGGGVPTEQISLNYEEIKWTYDKLDSENKSKGKVESTWKVEAGTT